MSVVYWLLTLIVLGSSAGTAAADFPALPNDSWYRVEIVVFERLADVDPASTQEILVSHAPRAYPRDVFAFDDDSSRAAAYPLDAETRAIPALPAVDTANRSAQAQPAALPATQPTPAERAAKLIADYQSQLQDRAFRFEPGSTLLLTPEDGRLQRSNSYRVVFHRAWIQPVPDRDQLRPILIQAGERIGTGWRIEGFLGITRGRFLHLDTCLWYAPDPSPDAQAQDSGYMELREQRKMRSGELHYLDHPKFGVLARVDPVQPPDALVAELARLAALPAQ
jgi:hypothetical protein